MHTRDLAATYREAHNIMRNVDGLQPQEAFDELLKYLFFKQNYEHLEPDPKDITIKDIRSLFSSYLGKANSWSSEIWRERKIYLSDACLEDVHKLLFPISFVEINYDVRSHALREFMSSELRKGLGIFLTPDEVVSSIIKFLNPNENTRVYDPACGSGTFLIEYLNHIKGNNAVTVHGGDKSARMLLLADLNLGHFDGVNFDKNLEDSLKSNTQKEEFDMVVTNPPFGVMLDARDYNFLNYSTCLDAKGYPLKKQSSEIVFIEKCFQHLKPGGDLAIVIPKSIATNNSLSHARQSLSKYGYIYGIMSLPPETFASTGTQTTTIVIFAKKYLNEKDRDDENAILYANIKNVGFDSTGRSKDGSQLLNFAHEMKKVDGGKSSEYIEKINALKKKDSFSLLENIFIKKLDNNSGILLSDLCTHIGTGKTPARSAYAEDGAFLIKVGNLSGSGINWEARDRNFVSVVEMEKRKQARKPLTLQEGDILLTSSAHSPVYIAKKSDIFVGVPSFLDSPLISFVGEVMLVRADKSKICPYLLLAFLRAPSTVATIQNMVRGQTAHLHANDLGQLIVPKKLMDKDSIYYKVAEVIKRQTSLSNEMNFLISEQNRLLAS